MKICTKCQIPQPLENFGNNKNKKDEKDCQCKTCHKQYREDNKSIISLRHKQWREDNKKRLKQYREENKSVIALKKKQWQQENHEELALKHKQWREENKEKISLQQKQYREENKEKTSLYQKQWREENKEVIALKAKQWHDENKEREILRRKSYMKTPIGRIIQRNAKHKRRTITKQGDVTTAQLRKLLDNATHCFYCNNPLTPNNVHIDHYVPLAKGGLHTITNLRVACKQCNTQKSDKTPEEFLKILSEITQRKSHHVAVNQRSNINSIRRKTNSMQSV